MASRMAARSTTHGTPVKSCITTRAGSSGTSRAVPELGAQAASAFTSSSLTNSPPALRSTFSMRIFTTYGVRLRSVPSAPRRQMA